MSGADWTTAVEARLWMNDYIRSNRIIYANFNTKHARERMFQRSGIYVVDLKDCGIWWDGDFVMHRANIFYSNVTDKIHCEIKMRAGGLGVFILKKEPLDSKFTVVTFYAEKGGSAEKYLINEIGIATKFDQKKRRKMLERSLKSRKSKLA